MKFNVVSVREVYNAIKKSLGKKSELMRQNILARFLYDDYIQ